MLSILAPSAAVRNLIVTDVGSKNATLSYRQPEGSHVNGILRKFVITVLEFRRDEVIRNYTCFNLASDRIIVKNNTALNGTGNVNGSSSLNETLIGNGTNMGNNTNQSSNGIEIFVATSHCVVTDKNENGSTYSFDYKADHFTVSFTGLLPYTVYTISVSTCTRVGCGPSANTTFRSHEYSK